MSHRLVITMVLKVVAIENMKPMAFVSLLFNDSNQVSCRNSLANGESLTIDSGQDTNDLLRLHTAHYELYPLKRSRRE
jgi:hypothetical protein